MSSGIGVVHEGDSVNELAVCGLAISMAYEKGLLRPGMLILRPRALGDLEFAVEGRETYTGGVSGLIARGVGIWGDACGTRS